MTPTRYAEACERAARSIENPPCSNMSCAVSLPSAETAATLRALAQALREGDDVTDEDCGTPLLYLLITLPTEPETGA